TLIKWFPDRPGMATGIAIMGFGGGALIASPWSAQMLESFGSDSKGIALAFLVHGLSYAVFMLLGVLLVRVPRPRTEEQRADGSPATAAGPQVSARQALRTPQFWLLWVVLCMNVTAGIGILEKAAPMITDFFADTSTPVSVTAAAGFV
ncbi:OFA family MFS transporter, partial [Streptomyces sp. SID7982]|nr:OFA family MFS transporter [Streptomyces sp. SID7982]